MSTETSELIKLPKVKTEWWTPRLALPLLAATAVRLALLAATLVRNGTSAINQHDTASYLIPGRNLLLHGAFTADGVPDLMRTPAYAVFVAITTLAGLPAAAFINVLVSVLSVLLVWRLTRTVFGNDRVALLAAWLFAFEPVSVSFSVMLMSETLFVTVMLLSAECLVCFLREKRLRVLAVGGFWLAIAALVRPVAYYLPIPLAIGLFLVFVRKPVLRWKAPAVLLLSVLPWIAAWQIRNRVETGYSGFCSITDMNLYFYIGPDITGRVEHRDLDVVQDELGYYDYQDNSGQIYLSQSYLAHNPDQAGWSQTQRLAFLHQEGVNNIRTHLRTYLAVCATAIVRTALSPGAGFFDEILEHPSRDQSSRVRSPSLPSVGMKRWAMRIAGTHPWQAVEKVFFEIALLAVYLLAARAVIRHGVHDPAVWLLLGIMVYFFAVAAAGGGPAAEARFRLPMMPFLCLLAAAGAQGTRLRPGSRGEAVH